MDSGEKTNKGIGWLLIGVGGLWIAFWLGVFLLDNAGASNPVLNVCGSFAKWPGGVLLVVGLHLRAS